MLQTISTTVTLAVKVLAAKHSIQFVPQVGLLHYYSANAETSIGAAAYVSDHLLNLV
jgi:hypothetical protein